MHIEDNEGSVFIVPPTKRDQSPIILGRSQTQVTTSRESVDGLEPLQFFHYARLAYSMMKIIGYSLNRGDGLNFGTGRHIPLQPFVLEENPTNYYDRTSKGLGYVTPPPQSESESDESLPSK